jgi:hypothetical protein
VLLAEESQLRKENIQTYAEVIQDLHESIQQHEEDWDKQER